VLEAMERELQGAAGPPVICLDTLVTVVDSERFLQDFRCLGGVYLLLLSTGLPFVAWLLPRSAVPPLRTAELVGQRDSFLTSERADVHDRRGVVVRSCSCE
jgi:hypothetical protein